jgi:hypothetical protein
MSDLKIYPSGFMGSAKVPQTEGFDAAALAKQIFNRSQVIPPNKYTASVEVRAMWETMVAGGAEAITFEFKERVLKLALSHFAEVTFTDWIQMQWDCPEYGDNHSRWIDETLKFVFQGTPRSLNTWSWCTVLSLGDNTKNVKKFSPTAKKLLFNGAFQENRVDTVIPSFVIRWVRQPNGISDLAASLHVLFGGR